jgi:FxsC-like protein
MPSYQPYLQALNDIEEPWVTVMVPWSTQDTQLAAAESDLREQLGRLLARRIAGVPRQCVMAGSGIPTLHDFGQLLPQLTMVMQNRFRRDAPYPPAGPPSATDSSPPTSP